MIRVLILDDDKNFKLGLKESLEYDSIEVFLADSALNANKQILIQKFDVYIFDIRLPDISGVEFYASLKAKGDLTPVIFMSSGASLSEVAEGMRIGAFDFLEKPFSIEKIISSIKHAVELQELKDQIKFYSTKDTTDSLNILGDSPKFNALMSLVSKVAPTHSPVLITGESGTGKELVAKKIHFESKRANKPFIKVNCSALPENLIESELFGYEKGAFTGATNSKKGYFELAHNGTIFLDEVGDMSLQAQVKVLRALQDKEIQKLGSEKIIKIDFRLIAATNKNLEQGIKEGWFREDLYYRLNVYPIENIPLKDRKDDIPVLAQFFLKTFTDENGMPSKFIDINVFDRLKNYGWPGNIRELKNIIERLAIISRQTITEQDLDSVLKSPEPTRSFEGMNLKDFKDSMERDFIVSVLKQHSGSISEAAEQLQIERTYLHKKITQHDIKKKEYLF
jgi:two-component system nitrogen regulation response regulator NtrX